jgi:flagellin
MPLNSVNTNVGAMVALQSLNTTNTDLQTVQSRINTGKKINSAKDNGAIWAIAQGQRAESGAINAVKESLQRGISTVDVAMSAGEAVSDILLKMKEKALSATDSGLSDASREALAKDFSSLRDQIKTVVDNASFNGVNMLKGATTATAGTTVNALASPNATPPVAPATTPTAPATIPVAGVNLQFDATNGITVGTTMATAADAVTRLGEVETDIKNVSAKLSALGTGSNALTGHLGFMSKLQDSLDAGVGDLVDADLAKESARLQALQTKQQLGVQALSIANQSAGIVLGLFR